MIAINKEEFAIMKPTACVTTLIAVTVAPPIETYINIIIMKIRSTDSNIISSTRYNFYFGLRTIK